MPKSIAAIVVTATLFGPGTVLAQTAPTQAQLGQLYMLNQMRAGNDLPAFRRQMRQSFIALDANADGKLDADDVPLLVSLDQAQFRANALAKLLDADLDGDGVITLQELRIKKRAEWNRIKVNNPDPANWVGHDERIEKAAQKEMEADTDHDGRITWAELVENIHKDPYYKQQAALRNGNKARELLTVAPAGQSTLTLEELDAALTAFFQDTVDLDRDGKISASEIDAAKGVLARASADVTARRNEINRQASCAMPKASDAAHIIMLGGISAQAMSTVALGPQNQVTGVGTIDVQPGEEPLYLVVTVGQPTIWQFTGAVERIERAVLLVSASHFAANEPGVRQLAGAVGLPAEKVSFPQGIGCIHFFTETASDAWKTVAKTVKASTGKDPSVISAFPRYSGFSVPSGKRLAVAQSPMDIAVDDKADDAGAKSATIARLMRDLAIQHPGGVVTIDLAKLVAGAPVTSFEVLPGYAGLIQLIASGAVTPTENGEFMINRKIRIPDGLGNAKAVKFVLRTGVAEPDGDIRKTPVISEATKLPLKPKN